MLSQNPSNRPNCSAILSHHFFWSSKKTVSFIADICSLGDPNVSSFSYSTDIFSIAFCEREWKKKLCPELDNYVKNNKSMITNVECPVTSLLHLVNYFIHCDNMPKYVLNIIGDDPHEICKYWLEPTRFPFLITVVWILFKNIQSPRILHKYYHLCAEFKDPNEAVFCLTPSKYIIRVRKPHEFKIMPTPCQKSG